MIDKTSTKLLFPVHKWQKLVITKKPLKLRTSNSILRYSHFLWHLYL